MHRLALPLLTTALLTYPSAALAQDSGWFSEDEPTREEEEHATDHPADDATPSAAPSDSAVEDAASDADAELDATEEKAAKTLEPGWWMLTHTEKAAPAPANTLPPEYLTGRRKVLKPIDGAAPPSGYVEGTSNRRGVWGGGIGVSAGSYLITLLSGALLRSSTGEDAVLQTACLPLIGPFITAGNDSMSEASAGLMVGLGLAQVTGFAMIIGGTASRKRVWLRRNASSGVSLDVKVAGTGASLDVSF